MSITAGYVILFIIVLRLIMSKAPRIFSYLLWTAVLFRLVVPFSFESVFSLVPVKAEPVPADILYSESPRIQSGIAAVDQTVNRFLPASDVVGASMNPMQLWVELGTYIWLAGIGILLIYSILSALRLYGRLKSSVHMTDNIYEFTGSSTPFVFGFLNPKIYLPAGISESERSYILAHEQTHIRRMDHIVKPFAFLVLCIHWFNPLVWAAFFLMSEDMELSCDESVLKQMGGRIKTDYSTSLLSLAAGKRIVGGCPLAFGENNIKGRIKNIMYYKKPAFWVIIIAAVIVAAAGIGLMSNPQAEKLTVEDYAEQFLQSQIDLYENAEGAEYKIIDSKITKLEQLGVFEGMLKYPVELWSLEYRLKPDDISKVMLAGGMNEIDGWITEDSSMGKPLLIFSFEGQSPRYLGCVYSGDGMNGNADTVPGRETLLRSFLESQKLLPGETYKGDHIVVQFPLSTGETSQLLLSQPVRQGDSGIWCVERWMDGNGTVYYDTPNTDGLALDYYRGLQEQCDNGHSPWRLDPLEVSRDYINNTLGQSVSLNDLKTQYNAGIKDFEKTPESLYIGFVSEIDAVDNGAGRFSFHLDPVEYLTLEDTERLMELNVNPDDLPNGFYIHNPNTYSQYFQGNEETRIRLIDWAGDMSYKEVTPDELTEYLENLIEYAPLFRVVSKDGYVQTVEEQYRP